MRKLSPNKEIIRNCRSVIALDDNDNEIHKFVSVSEAAINMDCSIPSISQACKNGTKCKGYYWKKSKTTEKITVTHKNYHNPKHKVKVVQLDLDGNIIKTFNTQTDAAKEVGVGKTSIFRAIKNKTICKGFKWEKV